MKEAEVTYKVYMVKNWADTYDKFVELVRTLASHREVNYVNLAGVEVADEETDRFSCVEDKVNAMMKFLMYYPNVVPTNSSV